MASTKRPAPPTASNFPRLVAIRCNPTTKAQHWELTDRQERLYWWNQSKIHASKILLVGWGGIGGNLARILVQEQLGQLDGTDMDLVEPSNLNRQLFVA